MIDRISRLDGTIYATEMQVILCHINWNFKSQYRVENSCRLINNSHDYDIRQGLGRYCNMHIFKLFPGANIKYKSLGIKYVSVVYDLYWIYLLVKQVTFGKRAIYIKPN